MTFTQTRCPVSRVGPSPFALAAVRIVTDARLINTLLGSTSLSVLITVFFYQDFPSAIWQSAGSHVTDSSKCALVWRDGKMCNWCFVLHLWQGAASWIAQSSRLKKHGHHVVLFQTERHDFPPADAHQGLLVSQFLCTHLRRFASGTKQWKQQQRRRIRLQLCRLLRQCQFAVRRPDRLQQQQQQRGDGDGQRLVHKCCAVFAAVSVLHRSGNGGQFHVRRRWRRRCDAGQSDDGDDGSSSAGWSRDRLPGPRTAFQLLAARLLLDPEPLRSGRGRVPVQRVDHVHDARGHYVFGQHRAAGQALGRPAVGGRLHSRKRLRVGHP